MEACSLTRQKVYQERTSTISRTRANKSRSTCSWYVRFPHCRRASLPTYTCRAISVINNLLRYSTQFTTQFELHWNRGILFACNSVQSCLSETRRTEYSSPKHCTIFTGTWNLNGKVSASTRVRFSVSLLGIISHRPRSH